MAAVLALLVIVIPGCRKSTPIPTPTTLPTVAPTRTAALVPTTPSPEVTVTSAAGNLPPDPVIAFGKTKSARALQFDFAWNMALTENGQTRQQEITGQGADDGASEHLSVSGPNPVTLKPITFEMFHTADRMLVKGLAFGPGTDLDVWYEFPAQMGNLDKSMPNPREQLTGLNAQDFLGGDLNPSGTETVDAQACQVWTTRPGLDAHTSVLAQDVLNTFSPDLQRTLTAPESMEVSVWTCADGYLHRLQVKLAGHDLNNTEDKAQIDFTDHFYDFDSTNIKLTPPTDVQPMPGLGPIPTAEP